jgi:hypothetical protein
MIITATSRRSSRVGKFEAEDSGTPEKSNKDECEIMTIKCGHTDDEETSLSLPGPDQDHRLA